jgi:hypothetical protein
MLNDECNLYEDKSVKLRMMLIKREGEDDETMATGKIKIEKYENKAQCCKSDCLIF